MILDETESETIRKSRAVLLESYGYKYDENRHVWRNKHGFIVSADFVECCLWTQDLEAVLKTHQAAQGD